MKTRVRTIETYIRQRENEGEQGIAKGKSGHKREVERETRRVAEWLGQLLSKYLGGESQRSKGGFAVGERCVDESSRAQQLMQPSH